MQQIEVKGLSELAATLRRLGAIVQKNGGPLKAAVRKGANKFRDRARELAPVKTGRLRDAITSKRMRDPESQGLTEGYNIYVRPGKTRDDKRGAFYAPFVEFGDIDQPKEPFMRPAFSQEATKVTKEFAGDLTKAITATVKRAAKAAA